MDDVYIKAIENNRNQFFIESASILGKYVHISNEINWVFSESSIWPNSIFKINYAEENVISGIQKVVEYIKKGEAPTKLYIGAESHPKDISKHLLANGFIKEFDVSGMAIKLNEINNDFQKPLNFSVQLVENNEMLYKWAKVVVLGLYNGIEDHVQGFYELMSTYLHSERVKIFAGVYDGEIVASSTLYVNDGIAGIYHVAVMPEFRNFGLGREITSAPLLFAREKEFDFVVLQASKLGQIVYEKLGFKVYCNLEQYNYEG